MGGLISIAVRESLAAGVVREIVCSRWVPVPSALAPRNAAGSIQWVLLRFSGFWIADQIRQTASREAIVAQRVVRESRRAEAGGGRWRESQLWIHSIRRLFVSPATARAITETAAFSVGQLIDERLGEALRHVVGAVGVVEFGVQSRRASCRPPSIPGGLPSRYPNLSTNDRL